MSLYVLRAKLGALRDQSPSLRTSMWAYDACKLTRRMVKRILDSWPSSAETGEILEELANLPEEVNAVNRTGPYADRVEDFAVSMEGRIAELRTYAQRIAEIEATLVASASEDSAEPGDTLPISARS